MYMRETTCPSVSLYSLLLGVDVIAHVLALLLDAVDVEDVLADLDAVAGQPHHALHVIDVGVLRVE